MTDDDAEVSRNVKVTREVAASVEVIFDLIADPSQQARWDGNDNLAEAPVGQRVRGAGDVFTMVLTRGSVRENHVVEFEEARRIAWLPADPGQRPAGHLWRWELEPTGGSTTKVTHTYDWSQLTDENRFARARSTTSEMLQASLDRLADLAETGTGSRT
ncbi:polyketide cyclase [Egibacter rhizosphaerae]|uniref:Polyketide cyclase n=1 Tax=Egibacter rhizosphaerae TaxID=1670831 RepID=A0A411YEP3_9ACTN|nr:SRPBCC family protein [Egibacter rhizosphaerae]QBI19670.1 polyketide cyclase [Egibacter rhizosphaerae]